MTEIKTPTTYIRDRSWYSHHSNKQLQCYYCAFWKTDS